MSLFLHTAGETRASIDAATAGVIRFVSLAGFVVTQTIAAALSRHPVILASYTSNGELRRLSMEDSLQPRHSALEGRP